MALSKVQSNSILDGAITASDLASSAISDKLGFTPSNVISNNQIISTSVGNVNTGSANTWVNVNTSVYKWELPSAGKYFMYATLRTRIWGLTGFLKCRLYNATDSTAPNSWDKMLQEFQGTNSTNNVQLTPVWTIEVNAAKTIYLQMWSTMTGEVGIQSDSNGWNEIGWIKLS